MAKNNDTWTRIHDLALVYIALAYGTDHQLADEELEHIVRALKLWGDDLTTDQVYEVVLEAMAIYLEDQAHVEVTRTLQTLAKSLNEKEQAQALRDVVSLAESDGVLLKSESSLINQMADIWGIKKEAQELLAQTTATVAELPEWSLLHDMCLLSIVLAHSTDNELSTTEIEAIKVRMGAWQPDIEAGVLDDVIRDAIKYYASQPDREALSSSVVTVRDALPPIQRLAFLDDMVHIARADGLINDNEKEMINSLSGAFGVDVKFEPQNS